MTDSAPLPQTPDAPSLAGGAEAHTLAAGRVPLCFIVDEEPTIRRFLSLVLQGSGIDTEEFADHDAMRHAISGRLPDLIFIDISLDAASAISSLMELGKRGYFGVVQLMSNRGSAVLENVKNIGEQQSLCMLPVLKKPFETSVIKKILLDMKIGTLPPVAARIGLDEALTNNWIEFWLQPKIDLRKKQLAGAEVFPRVRHPEYGVLSPDAFMPGADDASIQKFSELAVVSAIECGSGFAKLGVNLPIATNVPVGAIANLALADIVRAHEPKDGKWPGIVIDIAEEEIVTKMDIANDLAKSLKGLNVRLAIDDFGRSYSSMTRLKAIPFAEIKLDRSFVTDCGTSKVNAPICKSVIDLAHRFGSVAVAIGIEKAADAMALVSMGCDYGQGFLLGQPMPQERFVALLKQRAVAPRPAPEQTEQQTA